MFVTFSAIVTGLMDLGMTAWLFREPLAVPMAPISLLWALPVCLSIAAVYKAIKIEPFGVGLFAREVLLLFGTIVGVLILAAIGFSAITHWALGS